MTGFTRRFFVPAAALPVLAIAFLAGFTVERSLVKSNEAAPAGSSLLALDLSLIHEAWRHRPHAVSHPADGAG